MKTKKEWAEEFEDAMKPTKGVHITMADLSDYAEKDLKKILEGMDRLQTAVLRLHEKDRDAYFNKIIEAAENLKAELHEN